MANIINSYLLEFTRILGFKQKNYIWKIGNSEFYDMYKILNARFGVLINNFTKLLITIFTFQVDCLILIKFNDIGV